MERSLNGPKAIVERVSHYSRGSLYQPPSSTTLICLRTECMKPTFYLCLNTSEDSCLKVTGTLTKEQLSQSLTEASTLLTHTTYQITGYASELATMVTVPTLGFFGLL